MNFNSAPINWDHIEQKAVAGDTAAQITLGWSHTQYGAQARDENKAEFWLRSASAAGDLDAMRRLARILYDRNDPEALLVANQLIDNDDFYGYYMRADSFQHGLCGQNVDFSQADLNYSAAAHRGHLISELQLLKLHNSLVFLNPSVMKPAWQLLVKIIRVVWRNRLDLSVYR